MEQVISGALTLTIKPYRRKLAKVRLTKAGQKELELTFTPKYETLETMDLKFKAGKWNVECHRKRFIQAQCINKGAVGVWLVTFGKHVFYCTSRESRAIYENLVSPPFLVLINVK